ncbi:MAG: Fic family protein [Gordonia sp. (in: high G+C Gram-positive bacteria)]|uniref:Fic/DOC family protein n=1 Tax=Gordonia sp. (in: high G+C Gram-positive bacteria) TaxID=84139 RepID=UPI0039E6C4CF
MADSDWESTFIPGTTILANRQGFTDPVELREYEYALTARKQRHIEQGRIRISRTYGPAHLRSIHRALFGDLYDWAGEIRTYPMNKGMTWFASPREIGDYLDAARRLVYGTEWEVLDHDDFAVALARIYAYLNTAHPFREGNGRAAKLFVKQLADDHARDIDYLRVDAEQWNNASAYSGPDRGSFEPVPDTLFPVFRRILVPLADDDRPP